MSVYNIMLGAGGPFLFFRTITTNQTDYNLYNAMTAAGWNGQTPVLVDLTINSGVVIGASANTVSAFTVNSLPTGSSVKITNNGYIVGRGGQGWRARCVTRRGCITAESPVATPRHQPRTCPVL